MDYPLDLSHRKSRKKDSNMNTNDAGSDSGVGPSYHSISGRSTRTSSQIHHEIDTGKQQLLQDFHARLWHSKIPTQFRPNSFTTQVQFSSLQPSTSQLETWLLEKMATPTLTGKSVVEGFFQEVKLFAARSGSKELLSALQGLGLLYSGEQLANGFTACQTAAMWRNSEAVRQFGFENPENIFQQLEHDPDNCDHFCAVSALDGAAFKCPDDPEGLFIFIQKTLDLPTLSILLKIQSRIGKDTLDQLLFSGVENGDDLLCDFLLCVFGADIEAIVHRETGRNCLHIAASHGHVAVIDLLLRRGANPNAVTRDNELAEDLLPRNIKKRRDVMNRLEAYRKIRFESLRNLILNGESLEGAIVPADFAAIDETGNGLLTIAVEQGTVGIVPNMNFTVNSPRPILFVEKFHANWLDF